MRQDRKITGAKGIIKPVEPLGIGIYGAVFFEQRHYRKGTKIKLTPKRGGAVTVGTIHQITDTKISLLIDKKPMKEYFFSEISSIASVDRR